MKLKLIKNFILVFMLFFILFFGVIFTVKNINYSGPIKLNIPIPADNFRLKTSFYYIRKAPEHNNTGITMVILPGGAYRVISLKGLDKLSNEFTKRGINVVLFYYKIPDNMKKEDFPLEDLCTLIKTLRKNSAKYCINPDMIGLYGISAGGHLAAMSSVYFEKDTRPDFVVLISPAVGLSIDRKKIFNDKFKDEMMEFFKGYFSPEINMTENTSPTYICSGEDDDIVPVKYNKFYAQKLKEKNIKYMFKVYPKEGHASWQLITGDIDNVVNWVKSLEYK